MQHHAPTEKWPLFQKGKNPEENPVLPPQTTTVCNVKVKYIRPQYTNLKDWTSDINNVYIGRGGVVFVDGVRFPAKASEWANPFAIGKDGNRATVLQKFDKYVTDKLESDNSMQERLKTLRNKRLGCWCVDG